MSLPKPDLSFKEVSAPPNGWCHSGHVAPSVFKRDPAKEPEPTKFFQAASLVGSINGVYCEPCLIIAHAHARAVKEAQYP